MLKKVLDRFCWNSLYRPLQKAPWTCSRTKYETLVAQALKIEMYIIRKGRPFLRRLRRITTILQKRCLAVSVVLILWAVQLAINVRGTICQRLKNWKT